MIPKDKYLTAGRRLHRKNIIKTIKTQNFQNLGLIISYMYKKSTFFYIFVCVCEWIKKSPSQHFSFNQIPCSETIPEKVWLSSLFDDFFFPDKVLDFFLRRILGFWWRSSFFHKFSIFLSLSKNKIGNRKLIFKWTNLNKQREWF